MADGEQKPTEIAKTGRISVVAGRNVSEEERVAAFRICEAHSEEIVALVADYCDDGGRALLMGS